MSSPPEPASEPGEAFTARLHSIVFKESNRSRIFLLAIALSLYLLSLFVVCLMPGPRHLTQTRDEIIERRIIQVLCICLLTVCPTTVFGVCIKHPSVNNAIVMFVAGIGSGCVCALSSMMIAVNILLTIFDIVRGQFRLDFMEMIAINILVTVLALVTYVQTSLAKEVYSYYIEKEKNTNTAVQSRPQSTVSGGHYNGRQSKSSRTTGSYDFNSANYDFY